MENNAIKRDFSYNNRTKTRVTNNWSGTKPTPLKHGSQAKQNKTKRRFAASNAIFPAMFFPNSLYLSMRSYGTRTPYTEPLRTCSQLQWKGSKRRKINNNTDLQKKTKHLDDNDEDTPAAHYRCLDSEPLPHYQTSDAANWCCHPVFHIRTTVCIKQSWCTRNTTNNTNSNKTHFVSITLAAATVSESAELPRHRGSVFKAAAAPQFSRFFGSQE